MQQALSQAEQHLFLGCDHCLQTRRLILHGLYFVTRVLKYHH